MERLCRKVVCTILFISFNCFSCIFQILLAISEMGLSPNPNPNPTHPTMAKAAQIYEK